MIILENDLETWYQLTKFPISTGYVEPNTELLKDALKQEDDVFNKGDDVVVGGLDVVIRVVKDETDLNMDGFNSDEDEAPVKDEVPVR